jgi:hypothetical protein
MKRGDRRHRCQTAVGCPEGVACAMKLPDLEVSLRAGRIDIVERIAKASLAHPDHRRESCDGYRLADVFANKMLGATNDLATRAESRRPIVAGHGSLQALAQD